jgi:hypothetical protein
MCKSAELIHEMNRIKNELLERYDELREQVGYCNKLQQDYLHMIENEELDTYKSIKLVQEMKTMRKIRREAKNETKSIEPYIEELNSFNINENDIETRFEKLNNGKYHKRIQDTEEKDIYTSTEKLPKVKGTSVKIKFHTSKEMEHLKNVYSDKYEDYNIDLVNGIIELNIRRG